MRGLFGVVGDAGAVTRMSSLLAFLSTRKPLPATRSSLLGFFSDRLLAGDAAAAASVSFAVFFSRVPPKLGDGGTSSLLVAFFSRLLLMRGELASAALLRRLETSTAGAAA